MFDLNDNTIQEYLKEYINTFDLIPTSQEEVLNYLKWLSNKLK